MGNPKRSPYGFDRGLRCYYRMHNRIFRIVLANHEWRNGMRISILADIFDQAMQNVRTLPIECANERECHSAIQAQIHDGECYCITLPHGTTVFPDGKPLEVSMGFK